MNKFKPVIAVLLVLANAGFVCLPAEGQAKKTPGVFENPRLVKKYQQTISPETLAARLYFLASDNLEGRETGTRGQRLAAQYLAAQYRLLGLAPKGDGKSSDKLSPAAYFQSFKVYRETPERSRLDVAVGGSQVASSVFSAEKSDELAFFQSGGAMNASGSVVFAGYGIADDQLGYNDLSALAAAGISINDKWVLLFADEPLSDAGSSLLPTADKKPSYWSSQLLYKRAALLKAGRPKGILLVREASPRFPGTFADAAAAASMNARRLGLLSLVENSGVPQTFAVSKKLADRMLAPAGKTVESLRAEINRSLKPAVFELTDVNVTSSVERSKPLETENVLALIEGSDPKLKNETIVISAHYDHLGTDPNLNGDRIYNGAADDGSGTVAALSIAEAFAAARRDGFAPRRSILFVNFVGEEKGILGSSYYAYNAPAVPLANTVANINMDGVGGIDPKHPTASKNYIYLATPEKISDKLIEINSQVHRLTGSSLELTNGNGRGFSSDDQSFYNLLVPSLYYSTGRTEHYHSPGDAPETIDYEHLARVTQLIFANAWQLANQTEKISSLDRSKLKQVGYICPPCPFDCDTRVFDHPGVCPVCGMNLMPNLKGN